MLYELLIGRFTQFQLSAISMIAAFIITFLTLNMRLSFLPQDQGRAFAINGALSKGKLRGVGLVFVIDFILLSVLFLPLSVEFLIYLGLTFLIMLSGYMDDASEKPWNEYKKGLIDFVISVATMVTFLSQNDTKVNFLAFEFSIPYPVYFVLCVLSYQDSS